MTTGGLSYITMTGVRLGELAACSIAAIRGHREERLAKVRADTLRSYRASRGYRWDRWWGIVLCNWTEPTDKQILESQRGDPFWDQGLSMEEHFIQIGGAEAEEHAAALLRLAKEAGEAGTCHVTASDLAALWGYATPPVGGTP